MRDKKRGVVSLPRHNILKHVVLSGVMGENSTKVQQNRKPYKLAKIYKGKQWFVYWSYINPLTGKFERFQERDQQEPLNRIKSKKERLEKAEAMVEAINDLLKAGFNPFAEKQAFDITPIKEEPNKNLLSQSLEWYFEETKDSWAKSTQRDRKSAYSIISQTSQRLNLDLPLSDLKKSHIKTILNQIQKDRKFSNSRYNAYLETIKSFFSDIIDQWDDFLEYNPASGLKAKDEEETQTHEPHTDDERKIVADYLKQNHFELYVFSKIVYRTGIRPHEILYLKPENITNDIRLTPTTPNSKNKTRVVPIDEELRDEIKSLPAKKGQYIFSNGLKPGYTKVHRNVVSTLWKKIVKDGLGINKTLYSLKPTGADVRLSMGNTMDDVQLSFGHSSKTMTRIYDKHNREKQMSQERLKQIKPEF